MSVARISLSLPQSLYQSFLEMVKKNKVSKSQMISRLIKKEEYREKMMKIKAEFQRVALDPSYQAEAEKFAAIASQNYVRNIAPSSSKKR